MHIFPFPTPPLLKNRNQYELDAARDVELKYFQIGKIVLF
jgi:hypothetical protein